LARGDGLVATRMMALSADQTPPTAVLPAVTPIPRSFKASDLPLASATRAATESLAHAFKKKGGYDAIRKHVWEMFEASVCV
jgi:hypothetical protein